MEENIKELLRRIYQASNKEVDDARISEILSANANNPYAALEAAGEDSGLAAAMGSDWDPYGLMEQWGIEAPEESVRPEQPVEESIVPVGEMSVPKDKVPSKVKEIAGRGITSVRDLEKPDLPVRTAMDELPGQRVRFAETELSEEERKKDIVELLSSDLEYASTQEILDEASTEIADYTSASYAATNRIALMLDARKQQIQALSSEIGAEYGESVLGRFWDIAGKIGSGKVDELSEEDKLFYKAAKADGRFDTWYKNVKRQRSQINDFNASVLGKFEKDMSEEAKTRQQEIDIAYMSRAVNRDITAQFREPLRSRWNIFANSIRSIGDIFGAQKVLEFDDLDDDLKAEFESAETDADKRRIYQEQALRVRADRRREMMDKAMASPLEGMPVESYIERDGNKYVVEDGRVINVRDESGFSVDIKPFSKEAALIEEIESNFDDFAEEVEYDVSGSRLLSQGTAVAIDMLPMIMGSMAAGIGARALGAGRRATSFAAQAGSGVGSFFHTYHDNYFTGLEMFGDSEKASGYAAAQSGLTALIESFIGRFESNFATSMNRAQRATVAQATERASRRIAQGGSRAEALQVLYSDIAGEFGEEVADLIKEEAVNAGYQARSFEGPDAKELTNTFLLTTFATGVLAGSKVGAQVRANRLEDFRLAMQNPEDFANTIDRMADVMIERGRDEKVVRANANAAKKIVGDVSRQMADISNNFELSKEQYEEVEKAAIAAAEARVELQNTTNNDSRVRVNQRIERYEAKISKILNDSKDSEGVRSQEQEGEESGGTVSDEEGGAETTETGGVSQTQEQQQADEEAVAVQPPSQGSVVDRTNSKGVTQQYEYDEEKQAWTINGRKAAPAIQEDLNALFEQQQAPSTTPSTPPLSTPPLSTPPLSTPPLSTPPLSTSPATTSTTPQAAAPEATPEAATEPVTEPVAVQVAGQVAESATDEDIDVEAEGTTEGTTEADVEPVTEPEDIAAKRQREVEALDTDTMVGVEYTTKAGTRKRVMSVKDGKAVVATVKKNGELGSESTTNADTLLGNLKDSGNSSANYDSRVPTQATEDVDVGLSSMEAEAMFERIDEAEDADATTTEGVAGIFSSLLGTGRGKSRKSNRPQDRKARNTRIRGRRLSTQTSIVNARNAAKTDNARRIYNFLAKLRPTLKRLGYNIVVHKDAESLANALIADGMTEQEALAMAYDSDGLFDSQGKTIHVREDIDAVSTLHEAMHPMFAYMASETPTALRNLMDYILADPYLGGRYFASFAARYGDRSITEQFEEAVVEFFAQELFGRMSEDVRLNNDPTLLQKIQDLISAVLADLGFNRTQVRALNADFYNNPDAVSTFLDGLADTVLSGQAVALTPEGGEAMVPAQQSRYLQSKTDGDVEGVEGLRKAAYVFFAHPKTKDTPLSEFYEIPEIKAALDRGLVTKEAIRSWKGVATRVVNNAIFATVSQTRQVLKDVETHIDAPVAKQMSAKIDEAILTAPGVPQATKDYVRGLKSNAKALTDVDSTVMAEKALELAVREARQPVTMPDGSVRNRTSEEQAVILARYANAIFKSIYEGAGNRGYDMISGWQVLAMERIAAELSNRGFDEYAAGIHKVARETYRVSARIIQKASVHAEMLTSLYDADMEARKQRKLDTTAQTADEGEISVRKVIARLAASTGPTARELAIVLENMREALSGSNDSQATQDDSGEPVRRRAYKNKKAYKDRAEKYWKQAIKSFKEARGKATAMGPIGDYLEALANAIVSGYYWSLYSFAEMKERFFQDANSIRGVTISRDEVEDIFDSAEFKKELDRAFTAEAYEALLEAVDSKNSNSASGRLANGILQYIADNRYKGDLDKARAYFRKKVKQSSDELTEGVSWHEEVIGGLDYAIRVLSGTRYSDATKATGIAKMEDLASAVLNTAIGKSEMRKQIRDGEISIGSVISDIVAAYFGYNKASDSFTGNGGFASEADLKKMFIEARNNPQAFLDKAKSRSAVGKNSLIHEIILSTGITGKAATRLKAALNRTFDEVLAPEMEKRYNAELDKMGWKDPATTAALVEGARQKVEDAKARVISLPEGKEKDKAIEELSKASNELKKIEERIDSKYFDPIRRKVAKGNLPTAKDLMDIYRIFGLDEDAIQSVFGDAFDYAKLSVEDIVALRELLDKRANARFAKDRSDAEDAINKILQKADKHNVWVKLIDTLVSMQFTQALGSFSTISNVLSAQGIMSLLRFATAPITLGILYGKRAWETLTSDRRGDARTTLDPMIVLKGLGKSINPMRFLYTLYAGGYIYRGATMSYLSDDTYIRQGNTYDREAGETVGKIITDFPATIVRFAKLVAKVSGGKITAKEMMDYAKNPDKAKQGLKDFFYSGLWGMYSLSYGLAPMISNTLQYIDFVYRRTVAPYFSSIEEASAYRELGYNPVEQRRSLVESIVDEELALQAATDPELTDLDLRKMRVARLRDLENEALDEYMTANVFRKGNSGALLGPSPGLPGQIANVFQYAFRTPYDYFRGITADVDKPAAIRAAAGIASLGLGMMAFTSIAFMNPISHAVSLSFNYTLWPIVHAVSSVGSYSFAALMLAGEKRRIPSTKEIAQRADSYVFSQMADQIWTGRGMSDEARKDLAKRTKGLTKFQKDVGWMFGDSREVTKLDFEEKSSRYQIAIALAGMTYGLVNMMFDFIEVDGEEDLDCRREKELRGETDFSDCMTKKTVIKLKEDTPIIVTSRKASTSFTYQKNLFRNYIPAFVYLNTKDKDGNQYYEPLMGYQDIPGFNVALDLLGDLVEENITRPDGELPVWERTVYDPDSGRQVASVWQDKKQFVGDFLMRATITNAEGMDFGEQALAPAGMMVEAVTEFKNEQALDNKITKSAPMYSSVSRSVVNDLVTNFLPSKRFFQWVQAKVVLGEGEFVPKPGNNTDAFLNKFLQNADKHALINSIRGKRLAHAENQYYGGNDYDITGNPIYYSAWDVSTRFPIMEEKKLADLMRYAMSGDAAVYTADNQEIPFKDLPYEQQLIYKHPTLSWTYFYGQAFHVEQDGRLQTVYVEGWPESMHLEQKYHHARTMGSILRHTGDETGSKVFENEEVISDPKKVAEYAGKMDNFARTQVKIWAYYKALKDKYGDSESIAIPPISAFASPMKKPKWDNPDDYLNFDMRRGASDYINSLDPDIQIPYINNLPSSLSWSKFGDFLKQFYISEKDGELDVKLRKG